MYITGAFYFYFDLGLELNFYTKIYIGKGGSSLYKIIYGILILIYTLYSFFVSDGSEVRFIMVLTIVLIFSVVLEKGNVKKQD
ncbi:hypothetical protein ASE53_30230 [Bacillus sp. Root11]|uniref:Uncharacterized protein n=1 Tax=Bacillus thuringiensis subsp. israelensis TaxID=1430 RepID=A0A1L2Z0V7_BACTI|nr:putative membrane protein [Bacillus thuringiensis HD1002]APF32700.1 hypothetical protein ATN07_29850 [Bacillus thuringiensis serovar israelensis]KAA0783948.1 hypothetical protein DN406_27625 [Bacillus sp. BB56-3]KQB18808.1 hypothetical protein AL712_28640 [Bacillus thuringiensis]KRD87974.1 hypothetical protein ASE53_30230 [Bacillus sp. Root11]KRD95496.1 hypothetical protein ASE54_26230 [Bacillus sp. Root131]OTX75796.1 hypothetical protein BK719_08120 [Bacillus thuringiensis serovar novosib